MRFNASPELLQQMSHTTLDHAAQVSAHIDAALANPDSSYYQNHYKAYAAFLTDYLGGEKAYETWLTRQFPGRKHTSVSWQEKYEAVYAACELVDRHTYHPELRQAAIDALRMGLVND